MGGVGQMDGVGFIFFADADAVHDDQQQGAFSAVKGFQFFET